MTGVSLGPTRQHCARARRRVQRSAKLAQHADFVLCHEPKGDLYWEWLVSAPADEIAVWAAWQNGYAERLMRTIKEEEVYLSEYRDYDDAYRQIGRFLDDVYMHKRIHSALGYLTPAEFALQWQESEMALLIIP